MVVKWFFALLIGIGELTVVYTSSAFILIFFCLFSLITRNEFGNATVGVLLLYQVIVLCVLGFIR